MDSPILSGIDSIYIGVLGSGSNFYFFQLTITITAFSWNYVDILVVLISVSLRFRFDQLNDRIINSKDQHLQPSFWTSIRIHYVQLYDLVQFVDYHISPLILLALPHNLFIICVRVLQCFKLV